MARWFPWRMRCLSAALAAVMALSPAAMAENAGEDTARTVVEATCTEPGYILTTKLSTGAITVENLAAKGHAYGEWIMDAEGATRSRLCGACGRQETVRISSIPEEGFPTLHLSGSMEGIGKKQKVILEADFVSAEETFGCYAVMTMQGHTSYGYPKHNYTVRFYHDAKENSQYLVSFGNWDKEHKYILKANYLDQSQCRNLVGGQVWRSMVQCRDNLAPRIAALPTLGTVDGFPVQVYLNGEYFGLYTMNLHKDNDLYRMKDRERAALLICNRETEAESLFRSRAAFATDYDSDWELEFCGTKDEAWAQDSFNSLIDFVMTSSDGEFREGLSERLDVDAAIDYLILIYTLGLSHSGAKDLVMLHYGDEWIPSAFDMDEAFGLDGVELRYLPPEEFLPVRTDGAWDSATGSLLWDRLLTAFEPELRARYTALRADVLSEERLLGLVEEFTGSVPEAFYDMDGCLYENRPLDDPDMRVQMMDYIPKRLAALDAILEVDE